MRGTEVMAAGDADAAVDSDVDDVTLVVRAREGDVSAFEGLVRRYQGPMYRLAVRMLASRSDAEDVVQEVFLTVWRRLAQLQDDSAFVGWLYRMTTNRCLNTIRARKPVSDVESTPRPATPNCGGWSATAAAAASASPPQ